MSQLNKLYIAATGMITSVGFDAKMNAASFKAGLNRYQDSSVLNKKFEPMTLSLVPDEALPELAAGLKNNGLSERKQRMLWLCGSVSELLSKSIPIEQEVPIFLAGPESIPHSRSVFDKSFVFQIMEQTGLPILAETSRLFLMGRAGGAHAIDYAFRYMEANDSDICIVVGVDSYLDMYLLRKLDCEDRIKSSSSMDAFVPVEGAAFLLLVSEKLKSNFGKDLPYITSPGLAEEISHRYSDKTYSGDGLANTFTEALSNTAAPLITKIYSSLNDEGFGAKELGVASMRNSELLSKSCVVEHPADCFGNISAACVPAMLALAIECKEKSALIYGSSDGCFRGAVRLGIDG